MRVDFGIGFVIGALLSTIVFVVFVVSTDSKLEARLISKGYATINEEGKFEYTNKDIEFVIQGRLAK